MSAGNKANHKLVRSQFCETERRLVMTTLNTVVELLQHVLSENVEVVLHDMTKPENSVVAITNGHVTNRTKGDSILAGPKEDKGFNKALLDASEVGEQNSIISDYKTVSKNGVMLNSATAIFRDSDGIPFAGLCFNSDNTVPESAFHWISSILGKNIDSRKEPRHLPGHSDNLESLMDDIIHSAIEKLDKPISKFNKEEKLNAVEVMQKGGLFIVRGGVNSAAKALGVTRFTIYNYLEEIKERQ